MMAHLQEVKSFLIRDYILAQASKLQHHLKNSSKSVLGKHRLNINFEHLKNQITTDIEILAKKYQIPELKTTSSAP